MNEEQKDTGNDDMKEWSIIAKRARDRRELEDRIEALEAEAKRLHDDNELLRSLIRSEQTPESFDVTDDCTTELAVELAYVKAENARLKEEIEFYEAINVNDSFLYNVLTGNTINKKVEVGPVITNWTSTFDQLCNDIQAWRMKKR